MTDGEISIDNYSIVRRDRNRTGGGVCVFIRNDFAFSIRPDLQQHNDEVLFIELLLPKTRPILIGTIYRPPKQNEFLEHFEELLSNTRSDEEIVILGDFNICCMKASSSNKAYMNILKLFSFQQIISEPTRIKQLIRSYFM